MTSVTCVFGASDRNELIAQLTDTAFPAPIIHVEERHSKDFWLFVATAPTHLAVTHKFLRGIFVGEKVAPNHVISRADRRELAGWRNSQ